MMVAPFQHDGSAAMPAGAFPAGFKCSVRRVPQIRRMLSRGGQCGRPADVWSAAAVDSIAAAFGWGGASEARMAITQLTRTLRRKVLIGGRWYVLELSPPRGRQVTPCMAVRPLRGRAPVRREVASVLRDAFAIESHAQLPLFGEAPAGGAA